MTLALSRIATVVIYTCDMCMLRVRLHHLRQLLHKEYFSQDRSIVAVVGWALLLTVPAAMFAMLLNLGKNLGRSPQLIRLTPKGRITHFAPAVDLNLRQLRRLEARALSTTRIINPGLTSNDALQRLFSESFSGVQFVDERTSTPIFVFWLTVSLLLAPDCHNTWPLMSADDESLWLDPPIVNAPPRDQVAGLLNLHDINQFVVLTTRQSMYYKWRASLPTSQRSTLVDHQLHVHVDIAKFKDVAAELQSMGLPVIRMGVVQEDETPPPILSTKQWSATADLAVFGNALFHLCGADGSWSLSAAFNRPVLSTDAYQIANLRDSPTGKYPRMLMLFRLLRDKHTGSTFGTDKTLQVSRGDLTQFEAADSLFELIPTHPVKILRAIKYFLPFLDEDPRDWPPPSDLERQIMEKWLGRDYRFWNYPRLFLDDEE